MIMIKKITNKDIINGSFVIPDGVTKIGLRAFYGCSSLSSIIIPDGVTKIGLGAFSDCWRLESIIIPESVTEIGDYAFEGCRSLKKVSLPKKVKLGIDVFDGCHPDLEIIFRD